MRNKRFVALLLAAALALGLWPGQPAGFAGASAAGAAPASIGEEVREDGVFDRLRWKWRYSLTGEDGYELPVTDPGLQSRIDVITSLAQSAWETMNKSEGRSLLWDDATPAAYPSSAHIYETYKRLYRMALGYSTKGSPLYGDPALLADLTEGLDWAYENQYNETMTWQVNQHHWEINIPTVLVNIATLLYDRLTERQLTNYMNAVHRFAHDPTTYATSVTPSYGANRLSESLPIVVRGILVKDGSRLALVRDRLSDYEALIYPFVDKGNGWYRDGSFVSHDAHAYTGTYGLEQYGKLVTLLDLLKDTPWEMTDPRADNVMAWTMDGFLPLVHKGRLMDMVNGRSIARQGAGDHVQGSLLIDSLIKVIDFAEPEEAAIIKRTIKEWLEGKTEYGYFDRASIPNYLKVKALMDDPAVTAAPLAVYRQYAGMDRAVQQRPAYAFGLSLYSKRIYDFETIAGENKRGWYTSSGMTYLYDGDHTQFNDNYWATVDMKRLPGITVDAEYARPEGQSNKLGTKSWVGGVEAGEYGASGMELESYGTTLKARKSWFAFDNEIVALGSDISSADNRTIETIVDNRRLERHKRQGLTVDGRPQPSNPGWSADLQDVGHIHLQDKQEGGRSSGTGYVFPDGNAAVKALREVRSGSWQDVSASTDATVYDNTFLTLWIDHGKNPNGAGYSYILLPERTEEQTAAYAEKPDVTILERNEYVHAVRDNKLNVTAALFWQDVKRTVGDLITADKKAAVAVKETAEELDISVSDPTQENKGIIEVDVNRAAVGVVSADPSVKVLRLAPTVRLAVQTDGTGGRTQRVKLSLRDDGAYTALPIPPIADASVHGAVYDAVYGPANFGFATTMTVVDTPDAAKTKRAYVTFDLGSVASVDRAVLQVRTSSASGKAATLTVAGAGSGWDEASIGPHNAPPTLTGILDTVAVNGMEREYELDVTDYIRGRLAERQATLVLSGTDYEGLPMPIHTREHSYGGPRLIVRGTFADGAPVETIVPTYGDGLRTAYRADFDAAPPGGAPAGWHIAGTGAQAAVTERAGAMNDREARLTGGASGMEATASFEPQTGVVQAEFRVRANQPGVPLDVKLKPNASAAPVLTLSFASGGRMTATDGATVRSLGGYAPNIDYKIKIVVDTAGRNYDVYVDEVRKGMRLGLRQNAASVGALSWSVSGAGSFEIDDVEVGRLEARPPAWTDDDLLRDDDPDSSLPTYTVSDSFNEPGAVPQGWSVVSSGGPVIVADVPNATNRSLEMTKQSSVQSSALRTFNQRTGTVVVDYWYRTDHKVTTGAPYVRDAGNREVSSVLFSANGNIQAFDGATAKNLMPYETGKWYHIQLILDTVAKKTDILINGNTYATGFAFRNAAASGIAKLMFFSNAAAGTVRIDNVVVTSEEDRDNGPNPATLPRLRLETPDAAAPGQTFRADMRLESAGYAVNVERIQVTYDSDIFSFEGLEGGDPSAEYAVDSAVPGQLSVTWTKGGSGRPPGLTFRAKPADGETQGVIRLHAADLYATDARALIVAPADSRIVDVAAPGTGTP
ncbi:polysaccharide lyase family 8 super-sandwich domain-containing protein [Paenibacillus flagellatus]|nr:polysaccharide lyase family 8 super-sandwich domain-containing protein [Paenibacillus flagellatus]